MITLLKWKYKQNNISVSIIELKQGRGNHGYVDVLSADDRI